MLVGKLYYVVLECTNVFEKLSRHLRVKIHSAVLELVERGVIVFVNPDEVLLKTFKLVFVLWILVNKLCKLKFKLREIGRASVHVFLRL